MCVCVTWPRRHRCRGPFAGSLFGVHVGVSQPGVGVAFPIGNPGSMVTGFAGSNMSMPGPPWYASGTSFGATIATTMPMFSYQDASFES